MAELTEFLEKIDWSIIGPAVVVLVILVQLGSSFKIVGEYERMAAFLHGRFYRFKGPGLVYVLPTHMRHYRVRVGAQGILMAQNVARFSDIDLPVRPIRGLKLGDNIQVTGFEDEFAVVDGPSGVHMKKCPECGHEFI